RNHVELDAEIQGLHEGRDALHPYFAALKSALLERRLVLLAQDAARCDAQLETLTEQRDRDRASQTSLERALRDNGGDRLEQLAADSRRLENDQAQRQQKAARHQQLLASIGESPPVDEAAFVAQLHAIGERAEAVRADIATLDNEEREE